MAGAAITGVLAAAAPASATLLPEVCTGISNSLAVGDGYIGYIIDAAVWGKAFNYDTSAQAQNIMDSVAAYCPAYMPGLVAAAQSVSHSGSTLA